MSEEFDFESIKNKALEQLKSGKPLLGKDGAFAPLLESILNAALEGEMDAHLSEDERMSGNRRNGKMQKQVQTSMGEKWTMPIANWAAIAQQLAIKFGDRFKLL